MAGAGLDAGGRAHTLDPSTPVLPTVVTTRTIAPGFLGPGTNSDLEPHFGLTGRTSVVKTQHVV